MKTLSKRILSIALTVCVIMTAMVITVPVSASVASVLYSEDFDNLVSSAMFVPNDSSKAAGWEIIPNWTGSVERGSVAVQKEASHGGVGISDGRLHLYRHKRNGNGGNPVAATLALPTAMTGLNKVIDFDMTVRCTIEEATAGIEFNLINGKTILPIFGVEADDSLYLFKDGKADYSEANKTSFTIEDHTKNYHRFRVVVDATHCTVYFNSQLVGKVVADGFGTVTGIRFSATNDWIVGSTDLKNEGLIDNITIIDKAATFEYKFDNEEDALIYPSSYLPAPADLWDDLGTTGWDFRPSCKYGSIYQGADADSKKYWGAGIKDNSLYMYNKQAHSAPEDGTASLNSWGYVGVRNIFDGESYGKFSVDFDAVLNSNIGSWEGEIADAADAIIEDTEYAGLVFYVEREDQQQRWPLFGINQDNYVYLFKANSTDFKQLFVPENKTEVTVEDGVSAHYKVDVELGSDKTIIYTLYVNGELVGDVTFVSGLGAEDKALYQPKSIFFALANITDEKIRTKSGLTHEAYIDNIAIEIPDAVDKALNYKYKFDSEADVTYIPANGTYSPTAANYWLDMGETGWDFRPNNFRGANYSDEDYAGVGIKGNKLYMYNKQSGEAFNSIDDRQSWGYAGARNIFDGESYGKFSVDFDASLNSNLGTYEGQTSSANQTIANTQYGGLVFFVEREDKQQRWPLFGINQDNYVYLFKANSTDFKQLFVPENKTEIAVEDGASAHYKVDVELGENKTIIYTLYINGELVGNVTFASGLGAEDKALYQPKSIFFALANLTSEKTRDISALKHEAYIDNVEIKIPLGETNTSVKYNRGTKNGDYFLFGYSDPHGFTAETAATVVSEELNAASTSVSVDVLDDYTIRVNHTPANEFIGGNYKVTVGGDRFNCGRNGLVDVTLTNSDNKATFTYTNTGTEVVALLICAVYDNATGRLVDVKTKQGVLTAGIGKVSVTDALETAEVNAGEGQIIKAFIWNGLTLKPIL